MATKKEAERAIYPLTLTGEGFFHAGKGSLAGMICWTVYFKDTVSRDDLQHAVDTAMPRFPYFCTRPIKQDGRYILEKNPASFVVYESEKPIPPGDERIGGFLLGFGCWQNEMYITLFHGLADGNGMWRAVAAVLHYYGQYHYGENYAIQGSMLADTCEEPGEYADPMDYVGAVGKALPLRLPQKAFLLPEDILPPEVPQKLHVIKIPQQEFMRFTKASDGSPAAIISLFLCRAIDRVHPERTEPLVLEMPVDVRRTLGCDKTAQNCCGVIRLEYSDRLRNMPFDRQGTCFRGMICLQSDADHQKSLLRMRRDGGSAPSPPEKTGTIAPPMVSYMGKLDFGGLEKHFSHFSLSADCAHCGILLEISAYSSDILIHFNSAVETDAYYQAFLTELEQAGIPFEECPFRPFVPLRRTF